MPPLIGYNSNSNESSLGRQLQRFHDLAGTLTDSLSLSPSMTSPLNFTSDDLGVEDAELWAVIDSAAAAASRSSSNISRKPLAPKPTSPPQPQSLFKSFTLVQSPQLTSKTNSSSYASTVSHDGQVLQVLQEPWSNRNKVARLNSYGDENRMIVAAKPPSYSSPENTTKVARMNMYGDDNRMIMANTTTPPPTYFSSPDSAHEISPESNRSPCVQQSHDGGEMRHSLSGRFPSVSLFKEYQNAAMAILEKTDYTIIAGSPFIKKSGWRKIAFYFNLSFEIKDKSIEFDENRNVQRAEFIVRAHMQGGRYSDGWGSCERREKRFMKPNQDIPSTAETRAKNKACQDLLGIGQYRSGAS